VIKEARAKGPVFVVDGGNFAWRSPMVAEAKVEQLRIKGELILEAYAKGGLDGLVPGEGDLALGLPWLRETVQRTGVPMLAANLRCDGEAPWPSTRVAEQADLRVGLVGLIGQGARVPDGCVVGDPIAAAEAAVRALGDVDVIVALSQLVADDLPRLSAVPGLDLVVAGGTSAQYSPPRSLDADSLGLASGSRGKSLGVAALTLVPGAHGFRSADARSALASQVDRTRARQKAAEAELAKEPAGTPGYERKKKRVVYFEGEVARLSAQLEAATEGTASPAHDIRSTLVGLDATIADDAEIAARVAEVKLKIDGTAAATPATPAAQVASLQAGPYVGSPACAGCHPAETAQWRGTAHARAWATLQAQGRSGDQACFSCHATGAEQPGGPSSPAEVGELKDVGCESCHGPGRAHAAAPATTPPRPLDGATACTACHDGVRDEGRFDYAAYLPRVVHGPARP
jgi:hypothetical protein